MKLLVKLGSPVPPWMTGKRRWAYRCPSRAGTETWRPRCLSKVAARAEGSGNGTPSFGLGGMESVATRIASAIVTAEVGGMGTVPKESRDYTNGLATDLPSPTMHVESWP